MEAIRTYRSIARESVALTASEIEDQEVENIFKSRIYV
jgi:hypothetical protein